MGLGHLICQKYYQAQLPLTSSAKLRALILDISNHATPLGWAEKWKKDILKCADVDYYGTICIKQGLIRKNRILKILAG